MPDAWNRACCKIGSPPCTTGRFPVAMEALRMLCQPSPPRRPIRLTRATRVGVRKPADRNPPALRLRDPILKQARGTAIGTTGIRTSAVPTLVDALRVRIAGNATRLAVPKPAAAPHRRPTGANRGNLRTCDSVIGRRAGRCSVATSLETRGRGIGALTTQEGSIRRQPKGRCPAALPCSALATWRMKASPSRRSPSNGIRNTLVAPMASSF